MFGNMYTNMYTILVYAERSRDVFTEFYDIWREVCPGALRKSVSFFVTLVGNGKRAYVLCRQPNSPTRNKANAKSIIQLLLSFICTSYPHTIIYIYIPFGNYVPRPGKQNVLLAHTRYAHVESFPSRSIKNMRIFFFFSLVQSSNIIYSPHIVGMSRRLPEAAQV